MNAKRQLSGPPVEEVVLTMTPDEAAQLRGLMAYNVSIPAALTSSGNVPHFDVPKLMGLVHKALSGANIN